MAPAAARTERFGVYFEMMIPIGKDHTAFLTINDEALKALTNGQKKTE